MDSRNILLALSVIGSLAAAAPAMAQVDVVNFTGLQDFESVENYYNGGYGSDGSGPGANYGISFSSNAIVCGPYPDCNVDGIPGGPGAGALIFLSGNASIMDVAGGFTTGFSFYYAAPTYTGEVDVWSGLDGTGTLLAQIALPLTTYGGPGCQAGYCPFSAVGVSFSGTAESVSFAGTENFIAFADITLGSADAGDSSPVPEPSTLALFGIGMVGAGGARLARRRHA